MYRIILEDISSDIEIIIFPNNAKSLSENDVAKGGIVIISGTLNKEGDDENSISKLFFNSIEKVDSHLFLVGKSIVLDVNKDISLLTIQKIYDIIDTHKGDRPVFLKVDNGSHKITFKFKNETTHSVEKIIKQLVELEQ